MGNNTELEGRKITVIKKKNGFTFKNRVINIADLKSEAVKPKEQPAVVDL
jgi:hypothetical protein